MYPTSFKTDICAVLARQKIVNKCFLTRNGLPKRTSKETLICIESLLAFGKICWPNVDLKHKWILNWESRVEGGNSSYWLPDLLTSSRFIIGARFCKVQMNDLWAFICRLFEKHWLFRFRHLFLKYLWNIQIHFEI